MAKPTSKTQSRWREFRKETKWVSWSRFGKKWVKNQHARAVRRDGDREVRDTDD